MTQPTLAQRQEAAKQALANVMIEGFEPDAEFMQLWDQFITGEISSEEYFAIVTQQALEEDRQLQERRVIAA